MRLWRLLRTAISTRHLCTTALTVLFGLSIALPARADFGSAFNNNALQFAVLGEATNDQTNYNNGNIVGDIGIGSPRQFTISNASLTGNLRFSGASNTSGLSPDPDPGGGSGPFTVSGGGTFTGAVVANDPVVTAALTAANNLSQTLGSEAGASATISSGGSINASAGTLDSSGNRIFSVTSANFPNGIFTINGSASDYVVLNIGFNANLHGQILLAGGITTDHVIINMFGGNYATFTGGPTLDVNTNGLSTFGIFLDPNGTMSATHTDIQGRFFGGDNSNQQIVSGAYITAPPHVTTPEPGSLLMLGVGLLGTALWRRKTHNNIN